MLIEVVRTLSRRAARADGESLSRGPQPPADRSALEELDAESRAVVDELTERLESEIIRPFQRVRSADDVRARWEDWVSWFAPLFAEVLERMGGVLAGAPDRIPDIAEEARDAVAELRGAIARAVDDDLAATLDFAVSVIIAAERLRPPATADAAATLARAPGALVERLRRAAVGFALSLLLLHAALGEPSEAEAPGDDWPITFLVARAKRMAAVYYCAAREVYDRP